MSVAGVKTLVYHGDQFLGEADVLPLKDQTFQFPNGEIRIDRYSPAGERCLPLAIAHAISPSPFSFRCKIQAKSAPEHSPLTRLYLACFNGCKTAIVALGGDEELHLIAMPSKSDKLSPYFWCCSIRAGLYGSCVGMLNPRCLAIVFDLDETLIVANTMKSFEDKIEALSRRIDAEDDPMKVSGMSAELKRYVEDKEMLKQYVESDSVLENGRTVVARNEEVAPLLASQEGVVRPIIRLQERNIVLTRINPEVRDTSVLVRLRPAWEDLRSYLTAIGRKRFEVFVCTMAERDYAFEMWRLLDPETILISSKQLIDRLVCVKSGSRKSLINVFQSGNCHPKMAMVIDDRLKVWDNKDRPRVHVVPPFTPYYAPQAETANAVPVLCVARNVACNVRGGFFKEFDENLLPKIFDLRYENDISDLADAPAPDVSCYLIPEDVVPVPNGNKDVAMLEGISGSEVEASLSKQMHHGEGQHIRSSVTSQSIIPENVPIVNRESTNNKDLQVKGGSIAILPPHLYLAVAVLQEIARLCNSKVEFKSTISTSKELHFSVEALFGTEMVGTGLGRTIEEAQLQAAENSLKNLESNYLSFITSEAQGVGRSLNNLSLRNGNGFLEDTTIISTDEPFAKVGQPNVESINRIEASKRLSSVLTSIKELCPDGQALAFHDRAPPSVALNKGEYYFQVEVGGKVLGKGVGFSKEAVELEAAEQALEALKSSIDMQVPKRSNSSRSIKALPVKPHKEGVAAADADILGSPDSDSQDPQ